MVRKLQSNEVQITMTLNKMSCTSTGVSPLIRSLSHTKGHSHL